MNGPSTTLSKWSYQKTLFIEANPIFFKGKSTFNGWWNIFADQINHNPLFAVVKFACLPCKLRRSILGYKLNWQRILEQEQPLRYGMQNSLLGGIGFDIHQSTMPWIIWHKVLGKQMYWEWIAGKMSLTVDVWCVGRMASSIRIMFGACAASYLVQWLYQVDSF